MPSAEISNYIPNSVLPPDDLPKSLPASEADYQEIDDQEIGYKTPRDHRAMELYLAEILGKFCEEILTYHSPMLISC